MPAPPTPAVIPRDRYRRFGRTDLLVSPLGFGGAPIGNLDKDGPAVTRILERLLDHGVNLIDTAHAYYGSEAMIGRAVGARRDEYVLVRVACDEPIDWPEISLRFTLGVDGVHTAIVGTTRVESTVHNLAVVAKGPLPEAAVQLIRAAYRRADPEGVWPGLT